MNFNGSFALEIQGDQLFLPSPIFPMRQNGEKNRVLIWPPCEVTVYRTFHPSKKSRVQNFSEFRGGKLGTRLNWPSSCYRYQSLEFWRRAWHELELTLLLLQVLVPGVLEESVAKRSSWPSSYYRCHLKLTLQNVTFATRQVLWPFSCYRYQFLFWRRAWPQARADAPPATGTTSNWLSN